MVADISSLGGILGFEPKDTNSARGELRNTTRIAFRKCTLRSAEVEFEQHNRGYREWPFFPNTLGHLLKSERGGVLECGYDHICVQADHLSKLSSSSSSGIS